MNLQQLRHLAGHISTADYLRSLTAAARDEWRADLAAELVRRPSDNNALTIHYLLQYIDHLDHAGPPPRV